MRRSRNARSLLPVLLLAGCAPAPEPEAPEVMDIVVGGLDYTFDLPTTLRPGPIRIGFENRGEVPHELIVARLNPGVALVDVLTTMEAGGDPEALSDGLGGILVADPGETAMGRLYLELESGRTYVLLCMFQDEDDAPPHVALGMVRSFEVE